MRVIDYPKFLLLLGPPLGWDDTYLNNFTKQQKYLDKVTIKKRNRGLHY